MRYIFIMLFSPFDFIARAKRYSYFYLISVYLMPHMPKTESEGREEGDEGVSRTHFTIFSGISSRLPGVAIVMLSRPARPPVRMGI